ncbi:MAG: hypothetical protein GY745_03670 [Actinomycetia bacterium]|nr:hypothetical protein [Actinomycetes bacterium]MCP3913479.1 hypothetical protein [Actinomycetes bacterium]MCP4084145.1 hypothetical protein [Actinomycetes bacterium]
MNEHPSVEPATEPTPAPSVDALTHRAEGPASAGESSYDTSTAERIEREFAEVEAALGRLDESRYGICELRGEPIDDELLAADPVRRHAVPAHT